MKSPAFRFYPSDFWASPDVQVMDLHEVGAYISLLSSAWLSGRPGCLSDDDDKLRRWARMSREQWAESKDVLLSKFPVVCDGWRGNPRLQSESRKMEDYSASQSAKGKKGGRPKAGEKLEVSSEKPRLSVGLSPEKPSVSVSVSASVSKEQELNAPALHAPISRLAEEQEPTAPRQARTREKANPSEVEIVWAAYPLKKGKSKTLPIIERIFADLKKQGVQRPSELLVERIECWQTTRQKKQSAGQFVPEMPYPQKFFGRGDWDDPESKPTPKPVFVEVAPDEWLGPEGKL